VRYVPSYAALTGGNASQRRKQRPPLQAILEGLRRLESLLTDDKGKRELLERALEELKRHVAALQIRLEAVEQRIRG